MENAGFGGQCPLPTKLWYVYILNCSNGKNYTGCTNNLEDRLDRHSKGQVKSTANYLPIRLISFIGFSDKYKAFEFEKYLKKGSGRAFINRHFA